MDLNFEVKNQIIKRTDKNVIVNKSHNYLFANICFKSSEWEGVDKYAIFKDGWDNSYHIHLGIEDEFYLPIPTDVLIGVSFRLTVYGGELITTNEVKVILIPSGFTLKYKTPPGYKNRNVFIEIFEKLSSKIDNIVLEENHINCYIEGRLVCSIPLMTVDEVSDVAISGDYNDLINIPTEFSPSPHYHNTGEITNFEGNVDSNMELMLIKLTDNIIGM